MTFSADPPPPGRPRPSRAEPGCHPRARGRHRAPGVALVPGVALALAVSACGGSSGMSAAASRKQSCQQVGAVLAEGPDPDTDPGGHAEAQILPLRQVRISDKPLKAAVSELDSAYQRLFRSNGASSAAVTAVADASKKVNAICPGAAS